MLTKIEALTKFETKIVIDNFSCSLANSLRRIMIGEIPTISIDLVSVEINSSLICDEFLSHRLGLIPLKSGGARKMKLTRECECDDYCPNCSSLFTLNIKAKNPETGVYSTHLCNLNAKEDLLGNLVIPIHDSGSNSKFSYSPILIAKLKLGQQIKLLGVAKKGIGLDHSKWSPVSVIKLKTEPIFYIEMENLNLSLNHKQKKTLCQIGNGLFEFDFEKKRVEIIRKKKTNSDFFLHKNIKFMADFFKNQEISTKNILKLEKNFSKIIFEIETTGVLEAEEIFKNSVMILKRKLNILGINIEKISKNDLIYVLRYNNIKKIRNKCCFLIFFFKTLGGKNENPEDFRRSKKIRLFLTFIELIMKIFKHSNFILPEDIKSFNHSRRKSMVNFSSTLTFSKVRLEMNLIFISGLLNGQYIAFWIDEKNSFFFRNFFTLTRLKLFFD